MPTPPEPASAQLSRARTQGIIIGLVIGLIAGGVTGVMLPELYTGRVAPGPAATKPPPSVPVTPVEISLKGEGPARVVVVRNTSVAPLGNVKLDSSNGRSRATATVVIGTLAPGESREIAPGGDWDWHFSPGDTFEVSADSFAPTSHTEP
jgi:hypothetical protein